MADCPHGLGNPASCFQCMEDGPIDAPKTPKPRATSNPFPSEWRGCCDACGEWWPEQTDIVRIGDDGWAHASCAEPRR